MSEEKILENKQPQEATTEAPTEQKQPEAPPTEIKEAPKEENPIISYMKTIDISKEETLTNKIKKILVGLKEKGLWDIGQKLPYEIQRAIANYVGAKNEYSVSYAVKQIQKEALKKPSEQKPPTEAERLELQIEGKPKTPPITPEEKPPTEEKPPAPEKTYIPLTLDKENFKTILKNINNTVKELMKSEKDIYSEDMISLLSEIDSKIFGSTINVEVEQFKVDFYTILIIAIILHALPILPAIFKIPFLKKEGGNP
jgi:hypothetical protein